MVLARRRVTAQRRRRSRRRGASRNRPRSTCPAPRPSRAARARCRKAAAARARRAQRLAWRSPRPREWRRWPSSRSLVGIGTLMSRCGNSVTAAAAAASVVLLLDQRAQHRQRRDDRVAGRVLVEADDVAGVLAAELPALRAASARARSGRRPARARAECPRAQAPARSRDCSSACRPRRRPARRAAGNPSRSRRAAGRRRRAGPRGRPSTRRSPSPSSAMPMSAPCSQHRVAASAAGCVAPQPALMLRPSGSRRWRSPPRRARGTPAARRDSRRRARSRRRSAGRAGRARSETCSCRTRCSGPPRRRSRRALPSSAEATQRERRVHRRLDRLLRPSSGSLAPGAEKNLMPLSSNGLCDALITMPADRRSARVR